MDRSRLAGLCYIAERWQLWRRHKINYTSGLELMAQLGVRHWRNWMHTGSLLRSPDQINQQICEFHHQAIQLAQSLDIEVLGMNHDWFASGDYSRSTTSVPRRGTTAYQQTLIDYERSWNLITQEFAEVNAWEVGNEWNHDVFLKPDDEGPAYTLEEKARIAADMLAAACRGIRAANRQATVIIGGLASLQELMSESAIGIKRFYRYLFEEASSFEDSYKACFDIANWHPYFTPKQSWEEAVEDWVDANHHLFQYLRELGYKQPAVWMTEFGFADVSAPPERLHDPKFDAVNAGKISNCFGAIRDRMPFVQVAHYFRLFDDPEDMEWSKSTGMGEAEGYFGLYTEQLQSKHKAAAFRQFANTVHQRSI